MTARLEPTQRLFGVTALLCAMALDKPMPDRLVRPVVVEADVEPSDDGMQRTVAASPPALSVDGLNHENGLPTRGDLRMSLPGAPALDLSASMGIVTGKAKAGFFDLAKVWRYDAASSTLTVPAAAVAQLAARFPSQSLRFELALIDASGEFSAAYAFDANSSPVDVP